MLFVLVGIAMMLLNLAGMGPTAEWNWKITGDLWKFCVPFALAIAWWVYSDLSGLNRRREIAKMELKKANRRKENLTSLGLDAGNRNKGGKR